MNAGDAEYLTGVAEALRNGETVHREILMDAARIANPQIAPRERTEILERTILTYEVSGAVYQGRD